MPLVSFTFFALPRDGQFCLRREKWATLTRGTPRPKERVIGGSFFWAGQGQTEPPPPMRRLKYDRTFGACCLPKILGLFFCAPDGAQSDKMRRTNVFLFFFVRETYMAEK